MEDLVAEARAGAKRCGSTQRLPDAVGTFFTTMRLTSNIVDGNNPSAEDEGRQGPWCRNDTYNEIESRRSFKNSDSAKASMWMGDAWKKTFQRQGGAGTPTARENVRNWAGRGQQRAYLEQPRRRISHNVGTSSAHPNWQESVHQRARVNSSDGIHQRQSQRNGLLDDATTGTSKSKPETRERQ